MHLLATAPVSSWRPTPPAGSQASARGAGLLQGFMVTGAYFVPEPSVEQESMFPVLGGALLLGPGSDADPAGTGTHRARADGATDSQGEPHRLGFAVHGPDPVEVPVVMKYGEPFHDRDRGDHDVR